MKKIIILLVLFIGISCLAQKQRATLYFKDGSELKGYAKITSSQKIKFRKKADERPQFFEHTKIDRIIFEVDHMEYKYMNILGNSGSPRLLEIIKKGDLILYLNTTKSPTMYTAGGGYGGGGSITFTYFVAKKGDDIATTIAYRGSITSGFKKKAIKYFSDCPILVEKIKTKYFKQKDIIKIVEFYNNNCTKKQ